MRKRKTEPRQIQPDPRFSDTLVTSFVNNLMLKGEKSVAFGVFYDAMDRVAKTVGGEEALEAFKKAISNVTPAVEVRSRRIGGATFQIPSEIRSDRRLSMAMKWLIKYARERNGKSMAEKLSAEIVAASRGEGAAVKKKEDVHRMAEANKAFSHFRF